MQEPHGGRLIDRCRIVDDVDTKDAIMLQVNKDRAEDIENIAHGIFSPLKDFFVTMI